MEIFLLVISSFDEISTMIMTLILISSFLFIKFMILVV